MLRRMAVIVFIGILAVCVSYSVFREHLLIVLGCALLGCLVTIIVNELLNGQGKEGG